ncbi:MAG: GapS4b family protein [Ruminiclostridium sp.]
MGTTINCQTLLPIGEKLKPLLNKSCISEANMKDILTTRGVFIGDSSKKISVPLLTLSVLSPREFESLQEFQKTKEDSLKIKTSKSISLTQDNLNNIIPLNLIVPDDLVEETNNFRIDTDLSLSIKTPNELILDYEIIREDITKDWASNESRFYARVEVSKNTKNNEITFKSEFTSVETEATNYKIIKLLTNHLKLKGEISSKDAVSEISSDKFTNEERFTFMLQIANDSPNGFLTFEAVKNIEIGPDKIFSMPNGAKWMEGSVRNIIINSEKGETLENIEYISNVDYHKSLILRQIQAQYKFEFGGVNGTCIIEYGFPHYFRKYAKGTSFESSISNIYFSKSSKGENIKSTSRKILNEFQNLYQQKFDEK